MLIDEFFKYFAKKNIYIILILVLVVVVTFVPPVVIYLLNKDTIQFSPSIFINEWLKFCTTSIFVYVIIKFTLHSLKRRARKEKYLINYSLFLSGYNNLRDNFNNNYLDIAKNRTKISSCLKSINSSLIYFKTHDYYIKDLTIPINQIQVLSKDLEINLKLKKQSEFETLKTELFLKLACILDKIKNLNP